MHEPISVAPWILSDIGELQAFFFELLDIFLPLPHWTFQIALQFSSLQVLGRTDKTKSSGPTITSASQPLLDSSAWWYSRNVNRLQRERRNSLTSFRSTGFPISLFIHLPAKHGAAIVSDPDYPSPFDSVAALSFYLSSKYSLYAYDFELKRMPYANSRDSSHFHL